MPLPKRKKYETQKDFIARCMRWMHKTGEVKKFKAKGQPAAVCYSQYRRNPDENLRNLERLAMQGDHAAIQRLKRESQRRTAFPHVILRKFSSIGPCISLGTIVRETPQFWIVNTTIFKPKSYRKRRRYWKSVGGKRKYFFAKENRKEIMETIKEKRIKKDPHGLIHEMPCERCVDHPNTLYPYGWQD